MPLPALDPSLNLSDVQSAATSRTNLGLHAVAASGDHGGLSGLSDDDHPQYLNNSRGDARYQPLDSDLTAIAALSTTSFGRALLTLANQAALLAAAGAAASSHTHAISDTTGLQTALDVKAALAGATFTGTINGTSVILSGSLSAADGSGTNAAGADLVLQSGQATGNQAPASIKAQITTVGSSGATLQTLSDGWVLATNAVTSGLIGTFSCNTLRANGAIVSPQFATLGGLIMSTSVLYAMSANAGLALRPGAASSVVEIDGPAGATADPGNGLRWKDRAGIYPTAAAELTVRNNANSADAAWKCGNLTASGANVTLSGLPTSNPGGTGRLWNDSGTLKIT